MIDDRKWVMERLKEDNRELRNHLKRALSSRLPDSKASLEGFWWTFSQVAEYTDNVTVSKVYQEVVEEISRKIEKLK